MKSARTIYHLARADFLQRVRGYSFLLTLAFAAALAYLTFAGAITLQLDQYRGVYNSAWVGSMMTLMTTVFITLAGFYMVKNAVQRDMDTRVGLLLATTPISKSLYTIGKALSNFAALSGMVGVLAAASVLLQFTSAESASLEPAKLLAPFLWVALPAMAMTAALAVLFETVPVLRGGLGNVIYFFAWAGYIGACATQGVDDYLGLGFFMHRMSATLKNIDPAYTGGFSLQAGPTAHATRTFLWTGVDWTVPVLLGRLQWFAIAAAIAWLAALFFHRFDPASAGVPQALRRGRTAAPPAAEREAPDNPPCAHHAPVRLTRLPPSARGGNLLHLARCELRLMLKGRPWWWYGIAAGLFVAALTVPDAQVRGVMAAFASLWPILIWSQMGAREARFETHKLVFSCAHAIDRQLTAVWLAGLAVSIATGGGLGIRLLLSADWPSLTAWLAGVLFVPTLALALGAWSGSPRPFEAIFTVWWYIGAMNHAPGLDFTGFSHSPLSTSLFLIAALGLLAAAYSARRASPLFQR